MMVNPLFLKIYDKLSETLGSQYWWPGESPLEVAIGVILTQNTAWKNVEKAIANLKKEGLLSVKAIYNAKEIDIARHIRSSGYYNQKAKKLKAFIAVVEEEYDGDIMSMKSPGLKPMREKLLSINGIGEETADSILLYALELPSFVVDAYTRRIFSRHGIVGKNWSYTRIKDTFERSLPVNIKLFNDYHALIVRVGHLFCRKNPAKTLCVNCPLHKLLGDAIEY